MRDYQPEIVLARKFSIFALAYLAGVLLAASLTVNFQATWPALLFWLALIIAAAFVNFVLKNRFLVFLSFTFIFLLLGFAYYSFFNFKTAVDWPYDQPVELIAKVDSRPVLKTNKQQFVVKVLSVKLDNGQPSIVKNQAKLLVNVSILNQIQFGDRLLIEGKISKPGVIDDFDYQRYLMKYPLYGTINMVTKAELVESKINFREKSYRALFFFSGRIENALNRVLPEPHASLAAGILLGQKRNISDDFQTALKRTGLTHIIALSGFNVTIIVSGFLGVFLVYLGRKRTLYVGLVLVSAFIIMTGAAASILRAAVFSLLIIFGRTLGRQGDQINLMLLAAVLIVLYNPFLLPFDVGFQLSFLAFAGLIFLTKPISLMIKPKLPHWLPESIGLTLTETLGAQIAVTPLIIYFFGTLSLISPLANIMVLWILPPAMVILFIVALSSLIFYPIGKIIALLLWPVLEYIIRVTNYLAAIPLSAIEFKTGSLFFVITFITLASLTIVRQRKRYEAAD